MGDFASSLMDMAGAGGSADAMSILFDQRMRTAQLAQQDALTRLKLQEQAEIVRTRVEASRQAQQDRADAAKQANLARIDAQFKELPTDTPFSQPTAAALTGAGIIPERMAPNPVSVPAPPPGIAGADQPQTAGPLPGTVANSPAPNQVQFHRMPTAAEAQQAAMDAEQQRYANDPNTPPALRQFMQLRRIMPKGETPPEKLIAEPNGPPGSVTDANYMLNGQPIVAVRQKGRLMYRGQDVTDQVKPFVPLAQSIIVTNDGPQRVTGTTATPIVDAKTKKPLDAKDTAQDATRKKAAQNVLAHIPELNKEAEEIDRLGLMGPVGGRWADFLAGRVGAGELAAGNPENARLLGKFRSDVGLLQSGMAMVHGGARGGGSPGMIARMEALINAKQMDLSLFRGATDSFEDWLKGYAGSAAEPAGKTPTAEELIKKYGG
jgi:hypothetical protein